MQSTDVELETDDLKEFVDMADVDDLDVSDGDDFFGDLGDITDLGEITQLSENPERVSMPDIDVDFCFERAQYRMQKRKRKKIQL